MAHIFFEKLENRRSTQSLYGGYITPYNEITAYYGISTTLYGISNPDPFPSIGYIPQWNSGYNPYMSYTPYSMWNTPFNEYTWTNPFSNFLGGIGNFFSPFLNSFRGFFGWQPSPWSVYSYPDYTYPGNIFPGDIRALYGISIDPVYPVPSYSPPNSTSWLLYGVSTPISVPGWPSDSYSPPLSPGLYMYAVGVPAGTSSAVFKI